MARSGKSGRDRIWRPGSCEPIDSAGCRRRRDRRGEAVGGTGQGPVSVLVLGWSRGRRWTDPALTIRSRRGTAYEHQNRRWSRNDPPAAIWRAEGSRQQDRAEPRTSPAPHVVSRETLRRPGKLHLEPQRYRLPGPDPPMRQSGRPASKDGRACAIPSVAGHEIDCCTA